LGRISVPEQKIIVDRPMVLSRLACNGIPASKVTLTGAEKVTVGWRRQVIKGDKFVEVAGSFLKKSSSAFSSGEFEPVRVPEHFAVPASIGDIEFAPHLVETAPADKAAVRVALIADGNQLGMREVTFQLKYCARRAVALTDIGSGSIIIAENVRIEETVSDEPEPADWQPPYGLVARRRIPAGTVIASNMVTPVKPEVVLKRNQTVLIRIEKPGLVVTAIGKAMQDGCAGEYIKVRNVDSKRVILARVRQDATVEPLI
jgi:flagella basal body P-ring formation protein FlgA